MRGPVTQQERSLAPDLARGIALLGIALANSVIYITGRELGPSLRPVDGTLADRGVDVLVGTFVDNRAFPMFTLLFAYGLVMLARRQEAHGAPWPDTRRLLLRRCALLTGFGVVHLLLLFEGDILTAYGILGLALVLLVLRASDRALRILGWFSLVVYAGFGSLDGIPGAMTENNVGLLGTDPSSALGAFLFRALTLVGFVFGAPFLVLVFLPPAVIGILLARRRVLERPAEHLPLLRRLTVAGLAVSIVGSVPLVLASIGVWDVPVWASMLAAVLHTLTGLAGAIAFAAGVGWYVGARERSATNFRERYAAASRDGSATNQPAVARPPRGVVGALAAVGRRSLTCYLLQSVLFVPLLAPWAGGLGVGAGTALVAVVGLGVYLVTVLVAVALERAGSPGPAEALLRRLTYGPRQASRV